jgi:hypothetical protein
MPRFPRLKASLVLLLAWDSACLKRHTATPPPPAPSTNQPTATAPASAATSSEAPNSESTTGPQEQTPYQTNKPAAPPVTKKPARSVTAPAANPAPPTSAPSVAPPAPAPKLGDILKPDEEKQYSASIDLSLSHAQASLNSIGGRQLSKDQQAEVEQIRNFIRQAQATRVSDPAGARSLAARAEVLARDLAASSH